MENKQIIHIASEVVVLCGLTFYFSSKNKKLMGHIEELAQRLEEQEDHIQKLEQLAQRQEEHNQKLEQMVNQMGGAVTNLMQRIGTPAPAPNPEPLQHRPAPVQRRRRRKHQEKFEEPQVRRQERRKHIIPPTQEVSPPEMSPAHNTQPSYRAPQHTQPPMQHVDNQNQRQPRVQFHEEDSVEELENSDDEIADSDLDDEIAEELADLEQDDSSLKKHTLLE
jgi:hypothetical protein